MASGQTLLEIDVDHNAPPTANAAVPNTRNDQLVLEFDPATDQYAVFRFTLPRNYAGGGVTMTIEWAAASATTGNVIWSAAMERLQDGVDTIASDSFATAVNSAAQAAPGTSGIAKYTTIALTSGAQMDSTAAGESFRLKIARVASNVSDTMAGLAQLIGGEIRET